ncbi:MAG: IS1182 family transposase [Anderseniella sp.]
MDRFIEGVNRSQATLFPDRLEDWIEADNPVRVIDAFVDALDLIGLGFVRATAAATGRPGYHPAVVLKLYVYGYLNRVQSSRRLEREAGRNVEVMWLTGRLVPDHKTIADFRKDNGDAIGKVCSQFVELCRRIGLLSVASVAIDGSKFKAVNNRDRNFTKAKMARRMQQIEESVARYLHQLDSADRQEPTTAITSRADRLHDKIAKLHEEMQRLKALEVRMLEAPDEQISLTDPDSRSMATSGRGSGVVGYNVQAAVEIDHHLIVTHDVVQTGNDTSQLAPMAQKAKQALGVDELDVVADRGYFSADQIKECAHADVTPTLPKPQTSSNRKKGMFVKADFRYVADEDVYICPAGETLIWRYVTQEAGLVISRYWTDNCGTCPLKDQCTTGPQRRISRWEHEHLVEDMQRRLDENPDAMRVRRETVEHPFGTIKMRLGATHFLMKRLKNVKTEMALSVLAYNLTRVMNIIGIKPLITAIQA